MKPTGSVPLYQTIYRIGTLYTSYRLIIALSLTLIFLITLETQSEYYEYPSLYFYALIIYSFLSLGQLLLLRCFKHKINKQILSLCIIDLIFLNTLTFALGGPNISIGLLFVISVFSSNFLLSKNQSLFITLIAVICVVYQQFFGSLFADMTLNNIGNSVLLAFLFFVVYGIGQFAIQRFKLLDSLTRFQSNELFKLQNINRYILEQIQVGYLVLDEDFNIILSNPTACTLLGISPLHAYEQFNLASFQPKLFDSIQKQSVVDDQRFHFESKQSGYSIDVRVQSLVVPNQAFTLLILEDTQKLNQKVQQLKLAALGQLSASIAHEIRNPLAAIVQANELSEYSDTEQKTILTQIISKQAQRIDKIIADTLDMAKNRKTITSVIALRHFIDECMAQDLSDIKNRVKIDVDPQLLIRFDESQLRQVLINLLRNAIRHNPSDIEHILIHAYKNNAIIHIDVIDYGKGIAQQNLAQIFQPFFSTEINGTGLGLYLSQSICEANQAKLSYVEQKKQGACFRIECQLIK